MADARWCSPTPAASRRRPPALGVPCLTLRSNTERPATVTDGTNTLVGDDLDAAWARVKRCWRGATKGAAVEGWDGHAAERVVAALNERWG
jgi:UDP-N-acetylglucosamine 2-epimerase (non-hydrolysing)